MFFWHHVQNKKQISYECQVLGVTTAIKVSKEKKKTGYDRKPQTFSLSLDYRIVSARPKCSYCDSPKKNVGGISSSLLGGCLTGPSTIMSSIWEVVAGPLFDLSHPTAQQLKGRLPTQSTGSHLTIFFFRFFVWPMFHFERAMTRDTEYLTLEITETHLPIRVIFKVDVKEEIRESVGDLTRHGPLLTFT